MSINDAFWATVVSSGGTHSATVSWRFPRPLTITAQAAIAGYTGSELLAGEVGFSAYVQDGVRHTTGAEGWGAWAHVLFLEGVTQVDVSARSGKGWVAGSAVAYVWN